MSAPLSLPNSALVWTTGSTCRRGKGNRSAWARFRGLAGQLAAAILFRRDKGSASLGSMQPLRILVTGFSAFPRAPVNPTEVLIRMIDESRWRLQGVELRTAVLPVEYGRVPGLLCQIGSDFRPDIAIHFGLAETAKGFRLERTARNRWSLNKPDAAGGLPSTRAISKGGKPLASGLPLEAIAAKLKVQGLPVQFSSNAGEYLCNYTFYVACGRTHANYAPTMAGFVHVPFLDSQLPMLGERGARLKSLSAEALLDGARIVVETAAAAYPAARAAA